MPSICTVAVASFETDWTALATKAMDFVCVVPAMDQDYGFRTQLKEFFDSADSFLVNLCKAISTKFSAEPAIVGALLKIPQGLKEDMSELRKKLGSYSGTSSYHAPQTSSYSNADYDRSYRAADSHRYTDHNRSYWAGDSHRDMDHNRSYWAEDSYRYADYDRPGRARDSYNDSYSDNRAARGYNGNSTRLSQQSHRPSSTHDDEFDLVEFAAEMQMSHSSAFRPSSSAAAGEDMVKFHQKAWSTLSPERAVERLVHQVIQLATLKYSTCHPRERETVKARIDNITASLRAIPAIHRSSDRELLAEKLHDQIEIICRYKIMLHKRVESLRKINPFIELENDDPAASTYRAAIDEAGNLRKKIINRLYELYECPPPHPGTASIQLKSSAASTRSAASAVDQLQTGRQESNPQRQRLQATKAVLVASLSETEMAHSQAIRCRADEAAEKLVRKLERLKVKINEIDYQLAAMPEPTSLAEQRQKDFDLSIKPDMAERLMAQAEASLTSLQTDLEAKRAQRNRYSMADNVSIYFTLTREIVDLEESIDHCKVIIEAGKVLKTDGSMDRASSVRSLRRRICMLEAAVQSNVALKREAQTLGSWEDIRSSGSNIERFSGMLAREKSMLAALETHGAQKSSEAVSSGSKISPEQKPDAPSSSSSTGQQGDGEEQSLESLTARLKSLLHERENLNVAIYQAFLDDRSTTQASMRLTGVIHEIVAIEKILHATWEAEWNRLANVSTVCNSEEEYSQLLHSLQAVENCLEVLTSKLYRDFCSKQPAQFQYALQTVKQKMAQVAECIALQRSTAEAAHPSPQPQREDGFVRVDLSADSMEDSGFESAESVSGDDDTLLL